MQMMALCLLYALFPCQRALPSATKCDLTYTAHPLHQHLNKIKFTANGQDGENDQDCENGLGQTRCEILLPQN